MWAGQDDTQRFKTRVLKPPGGGSSDIFGAAPEETSPRRIKNHNASQLGSALFGGDENNHNNKTSNIKSSTSSTTTSSSSSSSSNTNSPESPRGNKPGNDSYKRLFGPPDAPSTTQNTKNQTRSNISLSGSSETNGFAINDIAGGSSCMPRNPVTGDGVYVTPFRRSARKSRDGNPVTGTGYSPAEIQNGQSSINGSNKSSSSDTLPAVSTNQQQQQRARVPPGGFSSGLW